MTAPPLSQLPRDKLARLMTEHELLVNVLDAAKQFGWRRAHFRPAQTLHGWRTPVQGDGKGFPDLILLRNGQGIAAELKRERKGLEPEQQQWLSDFMLVTGFAAYIWRPSQWLSGEIEKVLMAGR